MRKFLYILLLLQITASTNAALDISFGKVQVGEKRIPIDLSRFALEGERASDKITYKIFKNSTQWIRTENNILAPRALISLNVKSEQTISLKYEGKTSILQGKNIKNIKIYVNIFDPEVIEIYEGKEVIERLTLVSKIKLKEKEGHLIDYSCSQHGIEIEGLDDQYVSAGCISETYGEIGKEYNRLTLSWSTTNYFLENRVKSPYISVIMNKSPIELTMINKKGEKRSVTIKTNFKPRFKRLKTAIGFGPYSFQATNGEFEKETKIVPAFMIYGKWDLTPETSFRFFDALIARETIFNNAGLYFAYDLATAFDGRFKIVPLLGAQILTNKYDSDSQTTDRVLYPQGFEAVFKHAFGIENYNIVYGMFLSTDSDETYDNAWLRWGKGYFWEINYIRWGLDGEESSMWGLSIGIPTGQYF